MTYWQALGGTALFLTGLGIFVLLTWTAILAWEDDRWWPKAAHAFLVLILVSLFVYLVNPFMESS